MRGEMICFNHAQSSFRQALGLGPELFRHYLTQQIPDKDEVLRLVSRGYVTVDEYASILLWCLDGHAIGSYVSGNYPDGGDLFAELVTGAGRERQMEGTSEHQDL